MLCTILPNPSIDFPKSVRKKDIDSVRQALDSSKVVVRSCANIPHSIFLRHREAFENLLLVEPNAEKNKQNRKRKRFWGRKPRKYPLYFFPNEKTVCLPTFFVLGLTNGRYRKHLCSMGSPLTTKQKTKQPKLNLYGYQESVAEALLQRLRRPGPQGAQVVMGCGLGKTFFTIECIRRLGLRTLIVTHQDNISSQWGDRLAYGLPACTIGRVQQDVFDVDGHGVVICMIHTLCKRPFKPGTFSDFGLVVFDEVHHICAEMFSKCLRHLPCRCRIGLTATPRRKDGLGHVISWLIGPRICSVVRKTHKVQIKIVEDKTDYGPPIVNRKTQQLCYNSMLRQLCSNTKRTQRLAEIIAQEVLQQGRTVLVASGWAKNKHLGKIYDALYPLLTPGLRQTQDVLREIFPKKTAASLVHETIAAFVHPTIGYFVGESSKKNKKKRQEEVCLRRVVLTTFKMGEEAMDIPTINTLVLAMPKKGMEQMVGRITRGTSNKKFFPKVIDLVDSNVGVCRNMAAHRRREYRQLGYKIQSERRGSPCSFALHHSSGFYF